MIERIGILGGGQLARMLVQQGQRLGLQMSVYCENKNDPAAQVTNLATISTFQDLKTLQKFCSQQDLVTIESEFFPADLLAALEKQSKAKIFPQPKLLAQLQDRGPQKTLLMKQKVSTSPFALVEKQKDLTEFAQEFGFPIVLKARMGGYDGFGTYILKDKQAVGEFWKKFSRQSWIVEKFISFQSECAVSFARNRKGEIVHFPVNQTHQVDRRLDWMTGPLKTSAALKKMLKQLEKFVRAIDYVGLITFELFETKTGFLVNEIAPRVHNSGHASLEACNVDQFTAHLLAITNAKLPKISACQNYGLLNLIGDNQKTFSLPQSAGLGHLHWYGKTENRMGRKMGHITILASSEKEVLQKLKQLRKR